MPGEDARLAVERAVAHPDVGEDALSLLTTPGTVARPAAGSLESTTRKGSWRTLWGMVDLSMGSRRSELGVSQSMTKQWCHGHAKV